MEITLIYKDIATPYVIHEVKWFVAEHGSFVHVHVDNQPQVLEQVAAPAELRLQTAPTGQQKVSPGHSTLAGSAHPRSRLSDDQNY